MNHSIVMYTRWQKKALHLTMTPKKQTGPIYLTNHGVDGRGVNIKRENNILNEWVAVLVKCNLDIVTSLEVFCLI